MYPVVRLGWQTFKHRNAPPLGLGAIHESTHYCLPWDLDVFGELNNGRTLTFYDLGRIPLGRRTGLLTALKRRNWRLTVAGASVRYRRRIVTFEHITMRSRFLGWDARFFYTEQSMWRRDGDCAGHVLIRSAATAGRGIISPADVAVEMGLDPQSPVLPAWVQAWVAAEGQRPWPPMSD